MNTVSKKRGTLTLRSNAGSVTVVLIVRLLNSLNGLLTLTLCPCYVGHAVKGPIKTPDNCSIKLFADKIGKGTITISLLL